MYLQDNNKTVMTLENHGWKMSVEAPYSGISIESACQMFFTVMVGATFTPETILKGMEEFVEEHTDKKYEEED